MSEPNYWEEQEIEAAEVRRQEARAEQAIADRRFAVQYGIVKPANESEQRWLDEQRQVDEWRRKRGTR